MKVLGVYIYESFVSNKYYPIFSYQNISIGFTSILNEIQKDNNELDTIACSLNSNISEILKDYDISNYDLACFTTFSSQMYYIYEFIKEIKKLNKKIKIIVGGAHATLCPQDIAKYKEIDGIAIGEGIKSIKLYLKYLKKEILANQVKGYWIREGEKIIKNEKIEFIDFENFPIVDPSIWDKYVFDKTSHQIIVARGCVNRCSYCSNHRLKSGNTGKYVSFRKTDDIIKELKFLQKKFQVVNNVMLEMESGTINLKYIYELFAKLKIFNESVKDKISFTMNVHFTSILNASIDYFIEKLKEANVNLVCIGLECASHRIRKNILHRPEYKNKEFIDFCKKLTKNNISIGVYVLLGLPTETEYDLKRTISLLNKINPTEIRASIFYPYPNTDIYDLMKKMKIKIPRQKRTNYIERRNAYIDYPNLSKETIQKYYDKLENIYKEVRFNRLSKMILK